MSQVSFVDSQGVDRVASPTFPLPVAGAGFSSAVQLTRTADTNAYNANDVLGIDSAGSPGAAALEFAGIGPSQGGEIFIAGARFQIDASAVPSGMTSFRLYLYSVTPPSALLDNAPWDLPSGDRDSFRGFIDLGTPVDLGSTLYVEASNINKQVTVPAGGKLYGYLVTAGGYTPASGTVHRITLKSVGA